ncbi:MULTISPECIES: hypothetical protein [Leptolyngbya]|uniref:hypothetical protein n=1 Tax=Leptolyngbya TaxID=47251 RepID=UPI001683C4E3|nr:hypothetical protein [Leptolyngbya sp. FACHB-1624]MBD1856456.1 hypothetical protein [Leptolyngbya sp. FACHB-1624]
MTLFEIPEEITVYRNSEVQETNTAVQTNILVNFDLVTFWEREKEAQPAKGEIRLLLISPEQKTLEQTIYPLDLTSYSRSRLVIRIPVVTMSSPGVYRFRLELYEEEQWREVANIPLIVREEPVTLSSEDV